MTRAEVLVVGAGPAGIAAACAAAEHGRAVIVLDDNATVGGQIWRVGLETGDGREGAPKRRAMERLRRSGAQVLGGYRVFDVDGAETIRAIREDRTGAHCVSFRYDTLILATGARERLLPFPGWTLPGVFGAGGLQALRKGGFPIAGKRIVVAGTGPLLLAVAAHLAEAGAMVTVVAEQASEAALAGFGASLWAHPAKLMQGLRYRLALRKTAYRIGCWPMEAIANDGGDAVRAVRLSDGRDTWEEACDLLACGFHLVPNTELAALLGCAFEGEFVAVDFEQKTSIPNVYCVGEPTGIAGLDAALVQGEIAGLAVCGRSMQPLQARAKAERAFARRLEKAFALRDELRLLAAPETIVCRCEDVRFSALAGRNGWTDAKLQTRCGMGACQGRICGPALEFLFGWKPASIRSPIFPVPLDALCSHYEQSTTREEKA